MHWYFTCLFTYNTLKLSVHNSRVYMTKYLCQWLYSSLQCISPLKRTWLCGNLIMDKHVSNFVLKWAAHLFLFPYQIARVVFSAKKYARPQNCIPLLMFHRETTQIDYVVKTCRPPTCDFFHTPKSTVLYPTCHDVRTVLWIGGATSY